MLSLIPLALLGPSPDEIINQVIPAIEKTSGFRVSIEAQVENGNTGTIHHDQAIVGGSALHYWCKDETPKGEEFAELNGLEMIYTDDEGRRTKKTEPIARVIENWASSVGVTCWDVLRDANRWRAALGGHAFYVQSEEVSGRTCDVIGLISSVTDRETRTTIRYVWVDQQNHLPRTLQIHAFIRGRSTLGAKWVIDSITPLDSGSLAFPEIPARAKRLVSTPPSQPAQAMKIRKGDGCPEFQIQKLDGKMVTLASTLKGKTLVTFWASWCGPCQAELQALAKRNDVKTGRLRIVAVGVADSKQNLRAFANKGSKYIHFFFDPDSEFSSSRLQDHLAPDGIPHAYLFGSNGRFVHDWLGFEDATGLGNELSTR